MIWLFSLILACQETPKQDVTPKAEPPKAQKSEAPAPATKPETQQAQDFGAAFTIKEITPAKSFFAAPDSYVGKQVRVEGTVTDVCQKMGCWMVISDGQSTLRVTTKDHKFFVAKDGAGSKCHIEGEVIARAKDPERIAHFESESSEGAKIPEKEAKGDTVYEIVASSIRFIKE